MLWPIQIALLSLIYTFSIALSLSKMQQNPLIYDIICVISLGVEYCWEKLTLPVQFTNVSLKQEVVYGRDSIIIWWWINEQVLSVSWGSHKKYFYHKCHESCASIIVWIYNSLSLNPPASIAGECSLMLINGEYLQMNIWLGLDTGKRQYIWRSTFWLGQEVTLSVYHVGIIWEDLGRVPDQNHLLFHFITHNTILTNSLLLYKHTFIMCSYMPCAMSSTRNIYTYTYI